jgi:cold shock CspA family protein
MKGKVVSYVKEKKYGFVNGDDGESYFLHFSNLLDKSDETKLVKGVVLDFDPTPTNRGLAANKVTFPKVYFKKQLVDFFISKSSNPKHGNVEKRHSISTRFIKDPKESQVHIKQLAIESGCNSILNLEFEKDTFSYGNYLYTVHAYKGDFALVSEKIPCNSLAIEKESENELDSKIKQFDNEFRIIYEREIEARANQFKPKDYTARGVIALIFVFVLIIFAVID